MGQNGLRRFKRNMRRELSTQRGVHCHICGYKIKTSEDFTVDHYVPRAKGGTDTRTNLRPAHRECNRKKGDRLPGRIDWADKLESE
jgi:5-methylcytosine-specific restriction protein A